MTNQKLRQAWQAALDIEPIMKTVAAGRPRFYRMDYNLIHQEMGAWHVKMQGLPVERAQQGQGEEAPAGGRATRGEPIRFMTTQGTSGCTTSPWSASSSWRTPGSSIDLQVVDWATSR